MQKKLLLISLITLTQLTYSKIPGSEELSEVEKIKLKNGFIISYIINNIDALKSYDKISNTYKISNLSYACITLMSLVNIFQRESELNETNDEKKALDCKNLKKLLKNSLCIGAGGLFGLILPPVIQIPYYFRKCCDIFSQLWFTNMIIK